MKLQLQIFKITILAVFISLNGFSCLFSPAVQKSLNPENGLSFPAWMLALVGGGGSSGSGQTGSGTGTTTTVPAPSNLVYTGSPFTLTNGVAIATQTPTVTGTITSCSSSPILPKGLSINTTTCAISGTPTVNQGAASYTITASNGSGSTDTSISITINVAAPSNLTYTGSPFTFTNGSAITTQTPTVTGTVTSCLSTPGLPTGLSINTTTCAISGTPSLNQVATNYIITARNAYGNTTKSISITINMAAPSNLAYTGSPFTFTNGSFIATQTPTVTGTVTSCLSSPPLPAGLSIAATTCAISGTPSSNQVVTSYTITASNAFGNTTKSISITINMAAPSNLLYSGSPFTFTNGTTIATQTPTVSGTVTSCLSSPPLPAGLSINTTTCAISGTPTANQVATSYIITASNAQGSTTRSISITVNTITPVGTPAIASGSGITQSTQIVITFNRSMSPSSLSLTGLLASESNGGVWSTVTNSNDKLTITASSSWAAGDNRTLTVNCNDTIGTPMTTLNLSYGVLDGNIYVKVTGNNSNPGTQTQPKVSIQAAINLAASLYATANVRVAQGTYNEYVNMTGGISIYGGYSSVNWTLRNPTSYVTTIQSPGSWGVQVAFINSASAITIDGFSLTSLGSTGVNTGAVMIYDSNVIVSNNLIYGGGKDYSNGIYLTTNSGYKAKIWNNVINGGTGIQDSIGINVQLSESGLDIFNNTINGGSSSNGLRIGIFMNLPVGTPNIQNNLIFINGYGECIAENDIYSSYIMRTGYRIRNNNLYCQTAYRTTTGLCTGNGDNKPYSCTASEMESLAHIPIKSGNISVNPLFVNQVGGDYHLTASSPTSVTQGALDLSATFTTDKDSITRTAPWSIGAYEY